MTLFLKLFFAMLSLNLLEIVKTSAETIVMTLFVP